jgi:hypothetical protein
MIGAVALAESVDIQSGCVVHKNEKLARLIGTAERNIRRQLDDLASSGLILRLQQGRLAARFLIIEKLAAEQPSSSWPLDGHDRKAVISDKHDKLAIGRSQTWPPGGHNAGHSKFEVTDTSTTYAPHIMDDHGVDHGLSHRERALFCDDSIDRDSCSSPARAPEARAGDQGFDEVSIGLDPDRFEPELFI